MAQKAVKEGDRRYGEDGSLWERRGNGWDLIATPEDAPEEQEQGKAKKEKAPAARPLGRHELAAFGVMACAFGLPLWFVGARYSRDGWIWGVNLFSEWMGWPMRAQVPVYPKDVFLLLVIGVLYSLIERAWFFYRRVRGRFTLLLLFVAIYVLVNATDVGSTLLGVLTPADDAWPITHWLAATLPAAGAWSLVLTYLPEVLIIGGIRLIRESVRR
jgi:hypothetical protein